MQSISAGHKKTLETAQIILENGGNAFDAAIAAACTMFIAEPCMSSAGAAGFAMLYSPQQGPQMLDFFSQTPRKKGNIEQCDFYPIEVDFGNEQEIFHVGRASMAVPGLIKGIFALYNQYASMPIKDLLAPVKQFAKEGVAVDTFQYIDMGLLEPILAVDPSMRDVFFKDGRRLLENELLKMPNLHSFLDFLEREEDKGFYEGEIGQLIAQECQENGGFLERADFENYQAFWRKPLLYKYQNKTICLPNGPSLGGALMTLCLNRYAQDQNWSKAIYETREKYTSIGSIQAGMNLELPALEYQSQGSSISSKGTSHFNVWDQWGNAIAFTCSLGEGSGYFIPGTDMQMNNMLGESFLLPNGFHSWQENVRLNSMMTPTLYLNDANELEYLGGSGGAGRIPYMIAQVIQYIQEGYSMQEATNRARTFVLDDVLHTESIASLKAFPSHLQIKEWTEKSLFFGGVHSILKKKDGRLIAAADPRRFGASYSF